MDTSASTRLRRGRPPSGRNGALQLALRCRARQRRPTNIFTNWQYRAARKLPIFCLQEQLERAMTGNGDEDQGAGKWTDETLSMNQRHELLVQELARVAHKPRAVAGSQEHDRTDAPARDGGAEHAG